MRVQDLLAESGRVLRDAGVDQPLRDARVMLAHLAGRPVAAIGDPVDPGLVVRFRAAIAERSRFRPVSQIIGQREFWGRNFAVTGAVLDPRPETESLIALALAGPQPGRLLDLGTGSGILAVSLLAEWPDARAVAVDASLEALEVARENARRHGVEARLHLVKGDWFEGLEGRFELILSNPPYIADPVIATLAPEVRDWEPRLALSGGPDGLAAYRKIAAGLGSGLAPAGRALFEIGFDQAGDVAGIFESAGPFAVTVHRDLSGHDRVVEVTCRNRTEPLPERR